MSYEETILDRIQEHYDAVIEYGIPKENILGVFLYGSQNYKVDNPGADIDTKAIFIPTFEQLVLDQKMINHELHFENGEHCEIMDIRHLINNFRKQNINFIEVLFTEFYILNPKYEDIWNDYFISKRDRICRYDVDRAVYSIIGQALHTISQNKTDGKKLANGYRLFLFLKKYVAGAPYEECIIPDKVNQDVIKEMKRKKTGFTESYANQLLQQFADFKEKFEDGELEENYVVESKVAIDAFMNEGIMTFVKRAIAEEV